MELVHTSAPRGLRPGTRGFCTVAATQGMPIDLMDRLESMSGFKQSWDAADRQPRAVFFHVVLSTGGGLRHLISRIGPAPADYSGRTNRIAHHVLLSDTELATAGPAAVLTAPGVFAEQWSGEPRTINRRLTVDLEPVPPRPCAAWAALCGDAGWAGRVLEALDDRSAGPLYVLIPNTVDPLILMSEVVALLPESRRWEATFTSLFQGDASPDVRCKIRFVPGTPDGQRLVKASFGAQSLDLSAVAGLPAPTGVAAEAARTGTAFGTPQTAGSRRLAPPAPIVVETPTTPFGMSESGDLYSRPRRRSPQQFDRPQKVLVLLLVGTSLLLAAACGAFLMWLIVRPRPELSQSEQSKQAAPEVAANNVTPGANVPPNAPVERLPVQHQEDQLNARVAELEKLVKDAHNERDQARLEGDQHKANAETAQQKLKMAQTMPPPQFSPDVAAGLEAISETDVPSHPGQGEETVLTDPRAFSFSGIVRYSLSKETMDRSRNLKIVLDGGNLKVFTQSAVNGEQRTIGSFFMSSGTGRVQLKWKRDVSQSAKHDEFVLVLRNEQEQTLKVRVKCPEK